MIQAKRARRGVAQRVSELNDDANLDRQVDSVLKFWKRINTII